ncbi:MAG: DUF697 domain-containing protein [Clostridia bacterium]|nr:DUF697 domain-containing protein [Clostridia bacterium]
MKREKQSVKKMDLYEYEEKYVNKENYQSAKSVIYLVLTALGILVAIALVDFTFKAYQIYPYLGYGAGVVSLVVLVVFYVIPVAKLLNKKSFEVDVSRHNVKRAQRHNKQLRKELAQKFVDFNKTVENASWYSSEKVDALEYALLSKDDNLIKVALTDLYHTDVKKAGRKLIFDSARDVGIGSALSQNATLDTLVVATVNLKLIKDLVFLFGFRPTYPKLLKIYRNVMVNSLLAMGISNFAPGTSIANTVGGFIKSIPLLGDAVATVIDASVQGLANSITTAIIGFQTMEVLKKEYHLQNLLSDLDLGDYEENVKNLAGQLLENMKQDNSKDKKEKANAKKDVA